MEKLELLLALLVFRDRMDLANRVQHLIDLVANKQLTAFLIEAKRLGFNNQEIREVLWEVQSSNVSKRS